MRSRCPRLCISDRNVVAEAAIHFDPLLANSRIKAYKTGHGSVEDVMGVLMGVSVSDTYHKWTSEVLNVTIIHVFDDFDWGICVVNLGCAKIIVGRY